MDLTPPEIADRAPAGNPLITRPEGILDHHRTSAWTNRLVEHWATGLGPYQTRHDHYRVTVTGGHVSARPPLDLPFAVGHSPDQLRRLGEEVTQCNCWKDDPDRAWHADYIESAIVSAEAPTFYVANFVLVHPYLD
jgi:hypothetical protein